MPLRKPAARGKEFRGRTKRVLWVSTSMGTRGGIASYVRNMRSSYLWTSWGITHIATHKNGSAVQKTAIFMAAVGRFIGALVWNRPTITHFHTSARGSFVRKALLLQLSRLSRTPAILHIHSSEFDVFYERRGWVGRYAIRRVLGEADALIALGSKSRQYLQSISGRTPVVAIPNAVAGRSERPVSQPAAGVNVLFIGEIGDRKGSFTLLDAWDRSYEPLQACGARLTMAGDGEVERAHATRLRMLSADTVDIRGWQDAAATGKLLDAAHILVLPSTHEGQPMAILEAMSRGLCIIASDVGDIPDIVQHEVNGLIVKPQDVEGLAAALARAVTDAGERQRLGSAAWQSSSRHDVNEVARSIERLYEQIVRSSLTE